MNMSNELAYLKAGALSVAMMATVGFSGVSQASQIAEVAKIQLAILLDTSNSMDGLIDQTRNQLWQVVNEFAVAKRNGVTPILEIALYEYGNDGLPRSTGYIRQLNAFTRELDQVSQGLFSLTTNGGSEYCGYAIQTALNELQWSHSTSDIKTIFIAGNEPFTQGPVNFRHAIEQARGIGVVINTIHAGNHNEGIAEGWQSGARLAGGDYMSIDHNIQVVHFDAPQDQRIAELNALLNDTYIPYGAEGEFKQDMQLEQDEQTSSISIGLLAKRAKTKASAFYDNAKWDLVDAIRQGKVDAADLAEFEAEALPEPMQAMSFGERLDYVKAKGAERKKLQQEITALGKERDAFVAEMRAKMADQAPSMSDALIGAVKKQAEEKEFVFAE